VRLPSYSPVSVAPPITNELYSPTTPRSVTEGTTDLLPPLPAMPAGAEITPGDDADSFLPAPRRNERFQA
jgi:hypothetical protein